ncbi:hypothetical protein HanIR_Chr01g0042531 [Helianthus annuus]|nr:hypothetical protein HanIR_Chr01g0042531 [Helianthus annuus]
MIQRQATTNWWWRMAAKTADKRGRRRERRREPRKRTAGGSGCRRSELRPSEDSGRQHCNCGGEYVLIQFWFGFRVKLAPVQVSVQQVSFWFRDSGLVRCSVRVRCPGQCLVQLG